MIYTDGIAHDQTAAVHAWLGEEGHGGTEFSADQKKEIIDGGKTYHIVRYRYSLKPTLSEVISENEKMSAYLAADRSNLFDADAENAQQALTSYLKSAFEAAEPDENGRLFVYAGICYTDRKLQKLENAAYDAVYEAYRKDYGKNGIWSMANESYEGGNIILSSAVSP